LHGQSLAVQFCLLPVVPVLLTSGIIVSHMRKACYLLSLSLALSFISITTFAQNKPVLNHIALYVTDLKTSTHFYQQVIGLDTIPEPFHDGHHTWFSLGTHGQLHVISGASSKTRHNKNAHLCFSVASINDFVANLKKNGVEYENWAGEKNTVTKRVDGVQQLYFRDPDGYWIEINDDNSK
jgi:lactoylglutathione lyase